MITLVVFSKDRAMQLDSLLRSVKDHCTGIDNVAVIAKASSLLHAQAYTRILTGDAHLFESMGVSGPDGGPPLGHELSMDIEGSDHIALAVDDQLFYAPSDFKAAAEALNHEDAFVWSWRLGEIEPAKFGGHSIPGAESAGLPHWTCSPFVADIDYGYLWHSDGALYKTADYVKMLDTYLPPWRIEPSVTPNDLEGFVAARKREWAPRVGPHLGPIKPTCITWQLNLARKAYASGSPAFELPTTNLDALAEAYLAGKRVDNEQLYAALREDPLRFNLPGDRPTHVRACKEASRFWASTIR